MIWAEMVTYLVFGVAVSSLGGALWLAYHGSGRGRMEMLLVAGVISGTAFGLWLLYGGHCYTGPQSNFCLGSHRNKLDYRVCHRAVSLNTESLSCPRQSDDASLEQAYRLRRLSSLNLASSNVTDNGMIAITSLPALRFLHLGRTAITDDGLRQVSEMSAVHQLDLDHTAITDQGLSHLAKMQSLRYLDLSATQVTDAGLKHLVGHNRAPLDDAKMWLAGAHLVDLNLSGTPITDEGLETLSEMKGLTNLNVKGTRVTAAGVARFQARSVDCRVHH